jgi:dihydrolipoamide dehydrogenase
MTDPTSTQLVVIGSGPGGYSAAFRAADLGLQVTLIEREATLGGVCLNVGCIPSKVLLHAAKVTNDARSLAQWGIKFSEPQINFDQLRDFKNKIIKKLTSGLTMLAKQRKVNVIKGTARFHSPNELHIEKDQGSETIQFQQAIIAAGSSAIHLPFLPNDPRVIDSTEALEVKHIQDKILILGAGVIGMEMAEVYASFGAEVSVVEFGPMILGIVDHDIVMPLYQRLLKRYQFYLNTKVIEVLAKKDGLWVRFEGEAAPKEAQRFDHILVAVGRKPNGKELTADNAGITVDERGFIPVDHQLRTNVQHIFAIGDIVGNPMLAHKSSAQGRIAAEVIAGKKHYFEPRCIPSVAYTDPEIAWVGLTEQDAKRNNVQYELGVFPWAASGRALTQGCDAGLTKLIFDPNTQRILGAGIVGPNAGELISSIALAIEMGCDAQDIALTIHPHPTLSETVMFSAEIFEGTITDLYLPKKTKNNKQPQVN